MEVDLEEQRIIPCYHSVIRDPKADPGAWVFNNTTLKKEMVDAGKDPEVVSKHLSKVLEGCEVTAFNTRFDRMMIERDMKDLSKVIRWGECLMLDASKISKIPRKHANSNSYPTAQDTYNHLCPDDPAGINGIEEHRAQSDAYMESFILLELYDNGFYNPLPEIQGAE